MTGPRIGRKWRLSFEERAEIRRRYKEDSRTNSITALAREYEASHDTIRALIDQEFNERRLETSRRYYQKKRGANPVPGDPFNMQPRTVVGQRADNATHMKLCGKRTAADKGQANDKIVDLETARPKRAGEMKPPVSLKIPLEELKSQQCKWPAGDRPPYLFCGHDTDKGDPYCEWHSSIAGAGYTGSGKKLAVAPF